MVYVLVTVRYPTFKAPEMGKKYLELMKGTLPEFLKVVNTFVTAVEGIKVYTLYEIDDEKMFEGVKAIGKRMAGYFDVEGFIYTLEPLIEAKDALSMIGLG